MSLFVLFCWLCWHRLLSVLVFLQIGACYSNRTTSRKTLQSWPCCCSGCDPMWSRRQTLASRRNILSPTSGLKLKIILQAINHRAANKFGGPVKNLLQVWSSYFPGGWIRNAANPWLGSGRSNLVSCVSCLLKLSFRLLLLGIQIAWETSGVTRERRRHTFELTSCKSKTFSVSRWYTLDLMALKEDSELRRC
jgi:hypothetical protein